MRSRYFARARAISPLSRYVAIPQEASSGAASPSEKIYSFFFNELAEASADNYSHGQTIAYRGARWVKGEELLLGRKINPRSRTKRIENRGSKIEDRMRSAQGDPLSSTLLA
jgi:hypothetical protein